jgi:hypothetical protein
VACQRAHVSWRQEGGPETEGTTQPRQRVRSLDNQPAACFTEQILSTLTCEGTISPHHIMNWTGGSLQRHSKNAHNSVVNRQKEHFARIRIGLQNGANAATVPFRPSYLEEDNDTLCSQLSPFGRRSVRHVGHSKRTLKGRGSEASCRWEMESRYPRGNTKHLTEMLASRGRHHAKTQHRTSSSDVAASTTGNAHGMLCPHPSAFKRLHFSLTFHQGPRRMQSR